VGTGAARILLENADILRDRLGFPVTLKKIADLDIKRDRGIRVPRGVLTTNADEIIGDPDIDIVVELIGGIRKAKELILRALRNKKNVVTANKALLAEEGAEIFGEAERQGVTLGFEASVAGAIPIIKVMSESLIANRINAVYGIVNGTSNFILTKMTNEGADFATVLKEAQALGYAEADPTLDIEGIDSAHKLTLLASLAYGIPLSFKKVYVEGITEITPLDISFASELGFKIKLLAIAKASGGMVELRVHPTMIPVEYLISKVDGVLNAIYVNGDATGDTLYYGRGAGDMPTGSAVVADIADIARTVMSGGPATVALRKSSMPMKLKPIDDIESMYYFRFTALDRPGVLSKISGILGRNRISIASVIQKGRMVGGAVPLIILTHRAKEKDVRKALAEIDRLPVVSAKSHLIRVEGKEE
jgi:homoserine dehydrogenase